MPSRSKKVKELELGRMMITQNAMNRIDSLELSKAVARHRACDWGSVDEEDQKSNDRALENGERILSAYESQDDEKFWIITERDRSATTVLMPEDY